MKRLFEEAREMAHLVTQAVYFYRRQNYIKGNIYTIELLKHGENFFNYAREVKFDEGIEFLFPVWKELLEASENGNEIYLADIYESRFIPALFEIQACLINMLDGQPLVYWEDNMNIIKDKDTFLYNILNEAKENKKREYIFSWACTGDAVLSVKTEQYGQVLLSSSVNPRQEAVIYAEGMDKMQTGSCVIIGIGMGYHVSCIAYSSSFKEIIILENDLEQLRICMMYTDMKDILSDDRVKIVLCSNAGDYSKWLKGKSKENNTIYKIWYPSVKTIEDNAIRELLENYWVNTSSSDNLENVMLDNFENNQKLCDKPVDAIKDKFKNKDVVIIGAGPSLDNSLDYLRELLNRDNVVLVCVGKAAKKLIYGNIAPHYIVAIDSKKGTRWQTDGIEDCGVPLIYLSTAAYTLVSEYNGKRYIAYQEGISPSKEYAERNNLIVYQSGGSVATFAIDMAIRMECARIICVGLDMGYIGDNTHAEGIGRKLQDKKSLRKVEAVSGGEIYTSKTLDIYRRWIERRIENVKDTEFINASGGAKIHGMKEKSLKELIEGYYQQIIYCYVEKQEKELDKFVADHKNSSIIHIYSPVTRKFEDGLFCCLCDILDRYMELDKETWFITDIKELYDIVQQLYSSLFKEIVYIEQETNTKFNSGFEIDRLINYFITLQEKFPYYALMRKLRTLKRSKDINSYTRFLYELGSAGMEKNNKTASLLCCLCELFAYGFKDNVSENFYYNLTIYSILMNISNNVKYTNLYLNEVLVNSNADAGNMYFVWQQFKRISLRNFVKFDDKSNILCDALYEKCYCSFMEMLKEDLIKIPLNERNKNVVILLTLQFLDETHAPTRTVIERAKALKKSGKDVVIINTAEQYLIEGYVPLYEAHEGLVLDKYNEMTDIRIGEVLIPFLQIPSDLPVTHRMNVLTHIINKIKPYYILSIGTGSILADLCGNIVPCASMALLFSAFPKTKNKMKIIGRKLIEEEKEIYADEDIDIIESRFTFELKPQKSKFSRKEKGLPDGRFLLVVVGIRLEFEVDNNFMDMLSYVCKAGCYVVFAGIMDNYNSLMEDYPIVSANSLFMGYCDDILALMEICDLYVNPDRLGGGFSIIEAFSKGKPGVYLKSGDVYTAGGEDFSVNDFDEMAGQILKYKSDKDYYNKMSGLAKERAKLMTSSDEAITDIDRQICKIVGEKYW